MSNLLPMIETILPAALTLSILIIAFPLWFSVISVDSVLKEGHGGPLRLLNPELAESHRGPKR
jgi:hypothetical protein